MYRINQPPHSKSKSLKATLNCNAAFGRSFATFHAIEFLLYIVSRSQYSDMKIYVSNSVCHHEPEYWMQFLFFQVKLMLWRPVASPEGYELVAFKDHTPTKVQLYTLDQTTDVAVKPGDLLGIYWKTSNPVPYDIPTSATVDSQCTGGLLRTKATPGTLTIGDKMAMSSMSTVSCRIYSQQITLLPGTSNSKYFADHDDVIKRKLFRVTGPLWGEFTGQRWIPHTKASDVELWCYFLICAGTNGWENHRQAGDLRCHRAHYDVIVINIDGLVQGCSNSSALAMEFLLSCTKPSISYNVFTCEQWSVFVNILGKIIEL